MDALKPIRVVIVDDDEDDYVLVRDVLERVPGEKFDLVWMSSYAHGLKALSERLGQVYMVDYLLGAESGLSLLNEAMAMGVREPIILLTGQGNSTVDAAALRAGAADYLIKRDLDPERLGRALRYAIDRARSITALEQSEMRYRVLFERNPMPMWVYDLGSFQILAVNDSAVDHYGWSRSEFLKMTALDLRPTEEQAMLKQFAASQPRGLIKGGLWRHKKRDGSLIDVDVVSHGVNWDGHNARLVLAVDVTERLRAEVAVRESEERLRTVLADAIDALLVVVEDGTIAFANPAASKLFATANEELVGKEFELRAILTQSVSEIGIRVNSEDPRTVEAKVSATMWDGQDARLVSLRDITERRRAEEKLLVLERAMESSPIGFLISDARKAGLPTIYVNPSFEKTTGYRAEEIIGLNCRILQGTDTNQPEIAVIAKAIADRQSCEVVLRNYRKDGAMFWNSLSVAPVFNERAELTHFIGLLHDVTDKRRQEAELTYLSNHDPITTLPRYLAVEEYTRSLLAEASCSGGRVIMLYVDLDRFHTVNDSMGHAIGDQALRACAQRIRTEVGHVGRVSRIAGDEFVVVFTPSEADVEGVLLADSIRRSIEQPIAAPPYSVYLTCSIGLSSFPDNSGSATELLNQAEAAMSRAKRNGRNAVARFTNEHLQELADRLSLGGRLRDAARKGELLLHYQPQVSAQNGQVLGMEALVRWQSPELGFLPPGRFIRVAEELGLITDLGRWVLETACTQAKQWMDAGHNEFTLSVNVSAVQLQRPSFVGEVKHALEQTGLPAHHLELELTESSIMDNVERMIETMRSLREIGVRLALDDFGIGFSSLNHLKRFPIEKLKIDQSFVRDITRDTGDAGIARAIIAMGHQLGMVVLAEGVETAAQMGYLRRNYCDQFQGLFFSGPVRDDLAGELLARRFLAHESFSAEAGERTLLLLDDEENIIRSLTRLLRRDGYKIISATSAREAFELLGRHHVQVVISDQRMPDISGTEFLSQVRGLYPDTVRLVLSGYTDLRTVTDAINRGAIYKFLTKPWDDEELRKEIREAFRTHDERARP
jgi:diguanylate cyclase (GGDEF)-like protein/PAS domain S-box-containing protein